MGRGYNERMSVSSSRRPGLSPFLALTCLSLAACQAPAPGGAGVSLSGTTAKPAPAASAALGEPAILNAAPADALARAAIGWAQS